MGPAWWVLVSVERGGDGERRKGELIWYKYCVHMYVNEKWYLLKLVQEWGGQDWLKEKGAWGDSKYDVFDIL
jgi:hypothetical protein